MSSFNNVEKIKYTSGQDSIVSLVEYILFEDTHAEEKYAVFKFSNNLNQKLYTIRFEVMQYDTEGALLEKSVLIHDNFEAEPNAPFVPNAKMRVNFLCARVGVKLLFAAFDRVKWENGEFKDNSYKFDRYAEKVPSSNTVVKRTAPAAPAPAKKKKAQKPLKYGFSIRNIFRKNIAKFPKVFNWLAVILVVGFTVGAGIYFKDKSDLIYIDGFDLRTSDGYATVCGYDGGQSVVTVPDRFGKYAVTAIANGAFKNSSVKEVVFETKEDIRIESGAFSNCSKLQSVSSAEGCGTVYIMSNGFENCTGLQTVNLPTAQLSNASFNGSANTKTLRFDRLISQSTSLPSLFGGEKMSFELIEANLARISTEFFGDSKTENLIVRDPSAMLDYGALQSVTGRFTYGELENIPISGYQSTPTCDILNGDVIALNIPDGELTLPAAVTKIDAQKFALDLVAVRTLRLEAEEGSTIEGYDTLLASCPNLSEFISPVYNRPLAETLALAGTRVTKVGITGSNPVTARYLAGCSFRELDIAASVPKVDSDAFEGLNLSALSLPNYTAGEPIGDTFKGLTYLQTIEVKAFGSFTELNSNYFGGLTRLEEITVAAGINRVNANLVDEHPSLRKISFLTGIIGFGSPVIGAGCINLETVVISFGRYAPSDYASFNLSYAATRNLSVQTNGQLNGDFFKGCNRIARLSLTCGELTKGLLEECTGLNYLELHTDSLIPLAELFGDNPAKLDTLVLDSAGLSGAFFADNRVALNRVILLNTLSISGSLSALSAESLYLPETLSYDKALFSLLGTAAVGELRFEGSTPQNTTGLPQQPRIFWNYGKIDLYEF